LADGERLLGTHLILKRKAVLLGPHMLIIEQRAEAGANVAASGYRGEIVDGL
jgi:hypothetical protein